MSDQRQSFDAQLRGIEKVFEAAIDNFDNDDPDANLVPADVRSDSIRTRFSPSDGDEEVEHREKYSRCLAFLNTICASLSAKKVRDVTDEQREAVRRVYRFTTGPVRECAHGLDPNSQLGVAEIDVKRMTAEMHRMASLTRDVGLLSSEHTYS